MNHNDFSHLNEQDRSLGVTLERMGLNVDVLKSSFRAYNKKRGVVLTALNALERSYYLRFHNVDARCDGAGNWCIDVPFSQ